jgi:plasmid maintenance system killer protein
MRRPYPAAGGRPGSSSQIRTRPKDMGTSGAKKFEKMLSNQLNLISIKFNLDRHLTWKHGEQYSTTAANFVFRGT